MVSKLIFEGVFRLSRFYYIKSVKKTRAFFISGVLGYRVVDVSRSAQISGTEAQASMREEATIRMRSYGIVIPFWHNQSFGSNTPNLAVQD